MRPLVLSGFMATGKSTVGQIVAARLGVPFVDTDAVIAAQAGKSGGEIFATEGEGRFREREAALVLPMLEDASPRVIGFGGGTVTIPRVRHRALEATTVITLTASAETIVARVPSLPDRPNLLTSSPLAISSRSAARSTRSVMPPSRPKVERRSRSPTRSSRSRASTPS